MVFERIGLILTILLAILIIPTGIYLSLTTHNPHWLNRSGAALVATEGILAIIHFLRQKRLETVKESLEETIKKDNNSQVVKSDLSKRRRYVETEINKAEFLIVFCTFAFIILGEILHGFGDLIFEAIFVTGI